MCKRTPLRILAVFSAETLADHKKVAWYIWSDGKEDPTTKNTEPSKSLIQIQWRNKSFIDNQNLKRIQCHQTSVIANAKGTSLGGEEKAQSLSCVWLFATLWTVAHQAPLSMGLFMQEYWNGLPFPTHGHHPNPGIKPTSPALTGGFFTTESPVKSNM